jgi:hypothetical protein
LNVSFSDPSYSGSLATALLAAFAPGTNASAHTALGLAQFMGISFPSFDSAPGPTETTPKDSKESKRIDSIQKIIYDRIAAFEKDPEILRRFMLTIYEANITDLVIYILCIKISIIVHLLSYFF